VEIDIGDAPNAQTARANDSATNQTASVRNIDIGGEFAGEIEVPPPMNKTIASTAAVPASKKTPALISVSNFLRIVVDCSFYECLNDRIIGILNVFHRVDDMNFFIIENCDAIGDFEGGGNIMGYKDTGSTHGLELFD